jgi:acyl carrier protein
MATNLPAPTEQAEDTDLVLRQVLADVLGLSPERIAELHSDSGLFGDLPELDSMAVAGLLTELEDRLDIIIEDEDVDGEMLETFGGLLAFLNDKRSNG